MIYEYGEPWWNGIDREKTEELGEKAVPMIHCPPQIQHGLTWAQNQASVSIVPYSNLKKIC
jgi:hypothetical protein